MRIARSQGLMTCLRFQLDKSYRRNQLYRSFIRESFMVMCIMNQLSFTLMKSIITAQHTATRDIYNLTHGLWQITGVKVQNSQSVRNNLSLP